MIIASILKMKEKGISMAWPRLDSKVGKGGSVWAPDSLLFLLRFAEFSNIFHITVLKLYLFCLHLLQPGFPLFVRILSCKMVNMLSGEAIFLLSFMVKTQIPKSYGKPFLLAHPSAGFMEMGNMTCVSHRS